MHIFAVFLLFILSHDVQYSKVAHYHSLISRLLVYTLLPPLLVFHPISLSVPVLFMPSHLSTCLSLSRSSGVVPTWAFLPVSGERMLLYLPSRHWHSYLTMAIIQVRWSGRLYIANNHWIRELICQRHKEMVAC